MEKEYDDQMLPENYEQIARAYAKVLKNKGFVFVKLEEEEFQLLLGEIFVILAKMHACLDSMSSMDSTILRQKICESDGLLREKFGKRKTRKFCCKLKEKDAFLALVSLENLLVLKLMLLSVKSGELELCNSVITSISAVFAESFPVEGFEVKMLT